MTTELHLFDSGTLVVGDVEVPVPYFLIRHPDGDVVVDGGNPLEVAQDARAYWGPLVDQFGVHMTEDQHCAAQVGGVTDPGAVRYIVQTHLHMDHTGALGHFPNAAVVVHATELEAARNSDPRRGYIPADVDKPNLNWQTYNGDHDLFGDGSVRLIQSPGHSAGHVSVLVGLPETGNVLMTADASDTRRIWDGELPPRAFHSREQAAATLGRLHEVADEADALLIFGHDADNWASLQRSYR